MPATLGQPVDCVVSTSRGVIALDQDFWHHGVTRHHVYLPVVLTNSHNIAPSMLEGRDLHGGSPLGLLHKDPLIRA